MSKILCKVIVLLSILSIFSCQANSKFEGKWIITNVEYKNESIIEFVGLRNLNILFGEYGYTPLVNFGKFEESKIKIEHTFNLIKIEKELFIKIEGSNFFTDTFKLECQNKDCCYLKLSNEEKSIILKYDGSLNYSSRRKECNK